MKQRSEEKHYKEHFYFWGQNETETQRRERERLFCIDLLIDRESTLDIEEV